VRVLTKTCMKQIPYRSLLIQSLARSSKVKIKVKVKVKLSLSCNQAPRLEGVLREWRYSSTHSLPWH